MAERGATDREIAEECGVTERTLNRWKHTIEGFAEQLKLGKEVADERVEQSLYRRATGYTFDASKVFQYRGQAVVVEHVEHVPPDTTAAIFWLKNRRKDEWRDKHVVEHEGSVDVAARLEAVRAESQAAEDADRAAWEAEGNEGVPPAGWGPNMRALEEKRASERRARQGGLSDDEYRKLLFERAGVLHAK